MNKTVTKTVWIARDGDGGEGDGGVSIFLSEPVYNPHSQLWEGQRSYETVDNVDMIFGFLGLRKSQKQGPVEITVIVKNK